MSAPENSTDGLKGGAGRRRWVAAGGGALLAAGLVLWLFSQAVGPEREERPLRPVPTVGLARLGRGAEGELVREQAELLDPTPLFLPTHWNASARGLPADVERGPGAEFASYAPKLNFAENALTLNFPAAVSTPSRPVEALAIGTPPRPLLGFGRVDLASEPLPARGGFIEVVAAGSGEPVLAQALADAAPPADDWAPLEFLVAVDASGLVGQPQLDAGSGNDTVDAYFRNFLTERFRLGARLRPGFFRVSVGP